MSVEPATAETAEDLTRITVAVCVDANALVGLHVTLFSVLENLSLDSQLEVFVFHHGVSDAEFDLLSQTLSSLDKPYSMQAVPFDPEPFRKMKWLGGWMTYARLVVPKICPRDRLIYLDADLIVNADLSELWYCELNGAVIGAASWESVGESNDSQFFRDLGTNPDTPYFNAGVLLIDGWRWRERAITEQSLEIGERYEKGLPSADQTILNSLFFGDFKAVPRRFNTPVTASRPPLSDTDWSDRIVHLVARPKPWDPFGFLNGQSRVFRKTLQRTAKRGSRAYTITSLKTIRSCLRLSKAYATPLEGVREMYSRAFSMMDVTECKCLTRQ